LNNNDILFILGNGPSLKTFDFSTLSNYPTFGLNGALFQYQILNWYPTFYGLFDPPNIRKWTYETISNELLAIGDKFKNSFFFADECSKLKIKLDNIIYLYKIHPFLYPYDQNRFTEPIEWTIHQLCKQIKEVKQCQSLFDINPLLRNKLNTNGIVKYFVGDLIDKDDYLKMPRWDINHLLPKGYNEFYYIGGPASIIACQIGILMGYKKIALLGIDCTWTQKDGIVKNEDNSWVKDYFPNGGYTLKDFFGDNPFNPSELHIRNWEIFKKALKVNEINVKIYNCNKQSKLECFEKVGIEELIKCHSL
jgi:hypothetical protein